MNKIQYSNDPTGAYDYWKQDKGGEPLKEKSLEDMGYMVFEDGDGKQHKFYADLTSLENSYNDDWYKAWFEDAEHLKEWTIALPNLACGNTMFSGSCITSWTVELPSLETGYQMFYYCDKLTSWSVAFPNLTDGSYMFSTCGSLAAFSGALPNLTNGQSMFYQDAVLTSFSEDLPNLTNGSYMFYYCTGLTSWAVDLPKLETGDSMFYGCSSLTSFSGDLSSLVNGINMFQSCSSLTSFSGDLPKLMTGVNMFHGCKLDKDSVHRIAESIPAKPDGATFGYALTLGIDSSLQEDADVAADLETIKTTKKWTLYTQWK